MNLFENLLKISEHILSKIFLGFLKKIKHVFHGSFWKFKKTLKISYEDLSRNFF
jgi:hypothetical protein